MNAARPDLAAADTHVARKCRFVWELLLQESAARLLSGLADRVEDERPKAVEQKSKARVVQSGR